MASIGLDHAWHWVISLQLGPFSKKKRVLEQYVASGLPRLGDDRCPKLPHFPLVHVVVKKLTSRSLDPPSFLFSFPFEQSISLSICSAMLSSETEVVSSFRK